MACDCTCEFRPHGEPGFFWPAPASPPWSPHLGAGVSQGGRCCCDAHSWPRLQLRPGNVRASTRSTGPRKPPQNCSLPSALLPAPRQLQEAPLTREHCDSCLIPPLSQRGPFTAADPEGGDRTACSLASSRHGGHRLRAVPGPALAGTNPLLDFQQGALLRAANLFVWERSVGYLLQQR